MNGEHISFEDCILSKSTKKTLNKGIKMKFFESGLLIELSFTIPLDIWVGKINRKFPNIGFKFLAIMPITDYDFLCNSIISFTGSDFKLLEQAIKTNPSVIEFQLLQSRPIEITCRIKAKGHIIYFVAIDYNVIVEFPIVIENNQGFFKIVGNRQEIVKFLDDTAIQQIGFNILRISKYEQDQLKMNLTPRQLKIFKRAKEEGYYEIPRRITLTKLARKENISKATLSKIIQRIHRNFLLNIPI